MYKLAIDGELVDTDDLMKPLLDQMDGYAKAAGFNLGLLWNDAIEVHGHRIEGIDYSLEGIEDIRRTVIQLRDSALEQNQFEWSVALSHAIAMLALLQDLVRK